MAQQQRGFLDHSFRHELARPRAAHGSARQSLSRHHVDRKAAVLTSSNQEVDISAPLVSEGEVGAQPQEPSLKSPRPENVVLPL